jgi:hypothetical protein
LNRSFRTIGARLLGGGSRYFTSGLFPRANEDERTDTRALSSVFEPPAHPPISNIKNAARDAHAGAERPLEAPKNENP